MSGFEVWSFRLGWVATAFCMVLPALLLKKLLPHFAVEPGAYLWMAAVWIDILIGIILISRGWRYGWWGAGFIAVAFGSMYFGFSQLTSLHV
jgi:hypothetical protein